MHVQALGLISQASCWQTHLGTPQVHFTPLSAALSLARSAARDHAAAGSTVVNKVARMQGTRRRMQTPWC